MIKMRNMIVSENKYGILGLKLKGYFDWLPLGSRHRKVVIITK